MCSGFFFFVSGYDFFFFFSSRRRHTRSDRDWSSDVCSSDLSGTFRLVYIDSLRPGFRPESHVGHKLHAQGYLLSNEKGEGLSVTWLEAVASKIGRASCRERV